MTIGQPAEPPAARPGGTFADKTIIVTGGSRGIGRAIALRLAHEGGKLVLAARDRKALAKVVAEIGAGGGSASSFPTDLRLPEPPASMVQTTLTHCAAI